MTILLHRSKEPETCICCGRRASSIGIFERNQKDIRAWTCEALPCIKAAQRIVTMKANQISAYEGRAAFGVAKAQAGDVISEVLEAMFNAGVRDLSGMTEDQFHLVADALVVNGVLPERVISMLLGFGEEIRSQVSTGEAPF